MMPLHHLETPCCKVQIDTVAVPTAAAYIIMRYQCTTCDKLYSVRIDKKVLWTETPKQKPKARE